MATAETDIAAAARRLAETVRPHPGVNLIGAEATVSTADLLALLPMLDAVAEGQEDGARLARWARELPRLVGLGPHTGIAAKLVAFADTEGAAQESAAVAVLRQLEWVDSGGNECAVCFGLRISGHELNCSLNAVLKNAT